MICGNPTFFSERRKYFLNVKPHFLKLCLTTSRTSNDKTTDTIHDMLVYSIRNWRNSNIISRNFIHENGQMYLKKTMEHFCKHKIDYRLDRSDFKQQNNIPYSWNQSTSFSIFLQRSTLKFKPLRVRFFSNCRLENPFNVLMSFW